MLRVDLTAAKIDYCVAGKVFDFHALRSMYVTDLVKSGNHPKVVQTLARHSTMELTMQHYTKLGLLDIGGALDGLPALPAFEPLILDSAAG